MTADNALDSLFRDADIHYDAAKELGWNMVSPTVSEQARRVGYVLGEPNKASPKASQKVGAEIMEMMEMAEMAEMAVRVLNWRYDCLSDR